MTKCNYWDCGWCYADKSLKAYTNTDGGNACMGSSECDLDLIESLRMSDDFVIEIKSGLRGEDYDETKI